jgi:hypothetical protein
VHLDAGGVRLLDQVGQGIEPGREGLGGGDDLGRPLPRVQVPRVAAAAHLGEEGVRAGGAGVVHHGHHVGMVAEVRVEGVDPEGAVLGGRWVRGEGREPVAQGGGEGETSQPASREGSAHGTPLDWLRAKL